ANVGATWGDFVNMLADNARFLGTIGESVTDVSQLWNFEVQQAIGLGPAGTLETAVDASIATPGADLQVARVYQAAIDKRFVSSIFGTGWSTAWDVRLTADAAGNVDII